MNNATDIKIIFGHSAAHQLILQANSTVEQEISADKLPLKIFARAGNFYGSCKTNFSVFMLQQLHKAMQNFIMEASGEFTLYSESREFWASITGNGSGNFIAHCTLNDCDHKFTRLRFQVEFPRENLQHNLLAIEQLLSSLNH
jgi:hypothetical protein